MPKKTRRIMGICGWKNSGKTTLILSLIPFFLKQELRVGVIKKTHHSVHLDTPGKDSARYREVGASSSAIMSEKGWAIAHTTSSFPDIEDIISHMDEDIVLMEGFKMSSFPKIEVYSPFNHHSLGALSWPRVIGVVSDERPHGLPSGTPWLKHEDIASIFTLIMKESALI